MSEQPSNTHREDMAEYEWRAAMVDLDNATASMIESLE